MREYVPLPQKRSTVEKPGRRRSSTARADQFNQSRRLCLPAFCRTSSGRSERVRKSRLQEVASWPCGMPSRSGTIEWPAPALSPQMSSCPASLTSRSSGNGGVRCQEARPPTPHRTAPHQSPPHDPPEACSATQRLQLRICNSVWGRHQGRDRRPQAHRNR